MGQGSQLNLEGRGCVVIHVPHGLVGTPGCTDMGQGSQLNLEGKGCGYTCSSWFSGDTRLY